MNLNPFSFSDWSGCLDPASGVPTLGCIWVVLQNLISAALALSASVAVIFIIWSGIKFITSRGDEEAISSAKKTLTFAIAGFIFITLSWLAFRIILSILGVSPGQTGFQGDLGDKNSSSNGTCPDRSGNYSCGTTADTGCPLCSADSKCQVGIYSIASCSGNSPGCQTSNDCPTGQCSDGNTAKGFCYKSSPGKPGVCKSNCLPGSYPITE